MGWGLTVEEAIKFHGHKGPWLAIGYRAGLMAREKLRLRDIHDLLCVVRIPNRIPYTCSIDGVQASACCTMGKGNIVFENSNNFEFEFINRVSGDKLRLRIKRDVIENLQKFRSLEEAWEYIMKLNEQGLFELD
jgi:formylmethanofuran dehydrogenase subunit E